MKEQLILTLNDLQVEKSGKATLDDVTQEWADKDNKLQEYGTIVEGDDVKIATMEKNGIKVQFTIDELLNIIDQEDVVEKIEEKDLIKIENVQVHLMDEQVVTDPEIVQEKLFNKITDERWNLCGNYGRI